MSPFKLHSENTPGSHGSRDKYVTMRTVVLSILVVAGGVLFYQLVNFVRP